MALPDAVRKAAAAADEAQAQMDAELAELNRTEAETPEEPTPVEEQTPVEAPVEEEPVELVAEAEVEEPVSAEVPEEPETSEVDWEARFKAEEQRYNTLRGKYNSEVPRLQQQLTAYQTQPPKPVAPVEPEAPKGPAHSRYLKEDEVSEYGEEMLDMQARMAKGVAESAVAAAVSPLMKRVEYLESQSVQTTTETFWDKVEAQVPGARDLDASDPLWHEFLAQEDPMSGLLYGELGNNAIVSGDVARLVSILHAYTKSTGIVIEGEETPSPTPKKSPPVKPRKTAGKAPGARTVAKPTITPQDVEKFYQDVARGKYDGRQKERDAREREIEVAVGMS